MISAYQKPLFMKICHIISGDLWAGAETQALSLISGLSKINSIELSAITFNRGILTDRLAHIGIQIEVLDEKKHNFFFMFSNVISVLRKQRIDLIHVHGFKENFIGGGAAKLLGTTHVLRTHHGIGMMKGSYRNRTIEKINCHFFTDDNIAVSADLKSLLAQEGIGVNNIHVIHNGVDNTTIKPTKSPATCRAALRIPENIFIIGTIGRMERVKGHVYFLEGAQQILSKNNNVLFVIVGDGTLYDKVELYAKDLGIRDRVIFTGFRQDAIDLLNMMDIFTMTSLHEGVPMVLLEAMFLEKPIISTSVGGVPEIIRHYHNGLLIPPKDPDSFCEACMRLMEEDRLRKRISRTALHDAREKFTSEIMVRNTVQLYKRILKR